MEYGVKIWKSIFLYLIKVDNKYIIVAGERRFRAHKLLNKKRIVFLSNAPRPTKKVVEFLKNPERFLSLGARIPPNKIRGKKTAAHGVSKTYKWFRAFWNKEFSYNFD